MEQLSTSAEIKNWADQRDQDHRTGLSAATGTMGSGPVQVKAARLGEIPGISSAESTMGSPQWDSPRRGQRSSGGRHRSAERGAGTDSPQILESVH